MRMGMTERTPTQGRLPADGEDAGEAGGRKLARARWGRGVGEDEDGAGGRGVRRGSGRRDFFFFFFDEGEIRLE
jgi:hypothetical protein